MQTQTTQRSANTSNAEIQPHQFMPLDLENRPAVETAAAAYYLNRRPQTLRGWACHEDGPLRPFRLNSRLLWKTEDLRRLLGVTV